MFAEKGIKTSGSNLLILICNILEKPVIHDLHPCFPHGNIGEAKNLFLTKDEKIRESCFNNNINLIYIPNYWDGSLESLMCTIRDKNNLLFRM
jgi:hypothetical protein